MKAIVALSCLMVCLTGVNSSYNNRNGFGIPCMRAIRQCNNFGKECHRADKCQGGGKFTSSFSSPTTTLYTPSSSSFSSSYSSTFSSTPTVYSTSFSSTTEPSTVSIYSTSTDYPATTDCPGYFGCRDVHRGGKRVQPVEPECHGLSCLLASFGRGSGLGGGLNIGSILSSGNKVPRGGSKSTGISGLLGNVLGRSRGGSGGIFDSLFGRGTKGGINNLY